jgi:hypothetical protein
VCVCVEGEEGMGWSASLKLVRRTEPNERSVACRRVRMRQHTSAYVSIRQRKKAGA